MRRSLGNITQLDEGHYRVTVSSGYDKATGRRIRMSATVRGSERDAERELNLMLMRAGKTSAAKLTVTAFLEDVWLPTKEHRRRKTVEGYSYKISGCITPYIGHLPLKSVDAYVVERWMSDLKKAGKSPRTIRHARAVLKNAMRAAVRWRHIDSDPTEGVDLPRLDYRPKVLSAAQMNDYLDAFAGHRLEPIVVIEIAAGLRRSESTALEWSDIDFDERVVSIHRGLHQSGRDVWYEEPKSETSKRTLELPLWAIERLKPLRGVGPLVPLGGTAMPPNTVARLYKAHVEASGLPYVPIRDLRNSLGTYLYESGEDLSHIADRLGHSSTAITREHYVVRGKDTVERATVGAIERLRPCQFVPNDSSEHERDSQESHTESAETRRQAQ